MSDNQQLQQAVDDLESILDCVRWAVSQFNEGGVCYGHGTDNPWDEAVSLVLQALHLPQDIAQQTSEQIFHARLTRTEKEKIVDWIHRRATEHIPLAYLSQQAWFCGLPFYVDERVLVPRSPFAELINKRFSQWIDEPPSHILDLCTGSACIAIALAQTFEEAQIDAVDISDDALAVAEINISGYELQDRVFPIKSDLFSALSGQKYDFIVSNPPYVDAEDMADLPDEFHFEPELGLAAGEDGLDLVGVMLREAPNFLTNNGWLFVEVGNSMVHVEQRYPGLNLEWIEFEQGGHGVFVVSRAALVKYFNL